MKRLLPLMLGMVLLLGCVSTSLAAVGPITFSEYPIGTVVDDEYASLKCQCNFGYKCRGSVGHKL